MKSLNRRYFSIFIFFILCNACNGQIKTSSSLNCISAEDIHYEVFYESIKIIDLEHGEFEPSKYIVNLTFSRKERECLADLNFEDWVFSLTDSTSDFNANLALYYFFERDFTYGEEFKKEYYNQDLKKEEVDYWVSFLETNMPKLKQVILDF